MNDGTASLTKGLSCCDEAAWRAFHDQYYGEIHGFARSRGAAECDAPEIVQGVYLRVIRHAKVINDAESFKRWLACLVRCEVIDHSRKRSRRNWLNERFQQWQESGRDTEGSRDDSGLEEAMMVLSENDRTLVHRHYLDGWSQLDLANEQGISVKAVESKLARLRKRLRKHLGQILTDPT